MNIIRLAHDRDFDTIAQYEVNISRISFKDKAIVDHAFHKRKLEKAKDRSGMMVIASSTDDILGWMWMERKKNSVSGEVYVNFKSFYIDDSIRGNTIVDALLENGIRYARQCKATSIVGKVHTSNISMRSLYKNHGFLPTHITMEMEFNDYD